MRYNSKFIGYSLSFRGHTAREAAQSQRELEKQPIVRSVQLKRFYLSSILTNPIGPPQFALSLILPLPISYSGLCVGLIVIRTIGQRDEGVEGGMQGKVRVTKGAIKSRVDDAFLVRLW